MCDLKPKIVDSLMGWIESILLKQGFTIKELGMNIKPTLEYMHDQNVLITNM